MGELLRIENLSAGYGEAVIINGVSLQLDEGKTLALLGRNGTGKTTLMNTLAGATRMHGGSINLGGLALHKLSAHERAAAGIGWVPQERNIFKSLTVMKTLRPLHDLAGRGMAQNHLPLNGCMTCFLALLSAKRISAHSCLAVSSKC